MARTDLQKETRNWLKMGVLPSEAAKLRRKWAEWAEAGSELQKWHLEVAAEWERIDEVERPKVILQYRKMLDEASKCLARFEPGSEGSKIWLDKVLEIDYKLLELDPEHER